MNLNLLRIGLLLLGFLSTASLCHAAVDDLLTRSELDKPLNHYALRVWNTQDGLPHNSVNRMTQSAEGYLWLATWEGPVRYNGRDFTVFSDIEETKMPEAGALDVSFHAATERLYATGPRGGLVEFDGRRWRPIAVGQSYVFETVVDTMGRLWVAAGDGIYRIAANGDKQHYTAAQGLPDPATLRVFEASSKVDSVKKIWVATRAGLAFYDEESNRFVRDESIPVTQVRAIKELSNGVLVVSSDDGLYYKRSQEEGFQPWPEPVRGPITVIEEGPDGCLWVGTFEYGLGRICADKQEWISVEDGLPNSHVLDIFRDREDTMWVSTHGGFAQLRDALFTSFTPNHGLNGAYVRAINTDNNGTVWVGTNDGLSRAQGLGFEAVNQHPLLAALSLLTIAADSNNYLYLGSYTEGVVQLIDGQVTAQLNRADGLISNEVRVVLPLPDSDYLALGTPDGLYLVAARRGEFEIIAHYTDADGMASSFVTSIAVDDQGGLWVSSTASLTYFEPTDTPFEWQPKAIDLEAFTAARNFFATLYENERAWFATDRGLLVRDYQQQRWYWLSRAQGLPFEKLFTLNFDRDGNLWLGGTQGIVRISEADLNGWLSGLQTQVDYQVFTEADGMISRQLTTGGPASVMDKNGYIWFASALGAVSLNPSRLTNYEVSSPAAMIESVQMDTGEIATGGRLPASNSRVSFSYVALGYLMPEQIQYQVRLDGFDHGWIDRGSQLTTEYTALPPGKYRFQVRTRYGSGAWSPVTHFELIKEAYFYQQPWFWLLSILVFTTLVSTLIVMRIHALEQARRELQRLVKEQTKELEALAMQDVLTGLANRRAFDQRLAHELSKAKRYGSALAIGLLDLDYFKQINDRYLHAGGDVILTEVAHFIAQSVRDIDFVARWGGEEFAIIFPQTSLAEATAVLERIRVGVAQLTFAKVNVAAKVTVSIGVVASEQVDSSAALLQAADRALYQAKAKGRNQIVQGLSD